MTECQFCGDEFSNSGAKANHIKSEHPEKFEEIYIVELECDYCGKTVLRRRSKVDEDSHVFCDKECMGKWQRNEDYDYPKGWSLISERVKERDGYECQECGRTPPVVQLQVHHIDGDRSNNCFDNLVTLCASCHRVFENKISDGGG